MTEAFQVTAEMQAELEKELAPPPRVRRIREAQTAEALTQDRGQTHGDFRTNARLSQKLKSIYRSYDGWEHLDDVEKEVLDMISLKISRILSGKSLERQHWEDIEGYAHLALRECK